MVDRSKRNMVIVDPSVPVHEMTDDQIREMAGELFDALQAQRRAVKSGQEPGPKVIRPVISGTDSSPSDEHPSPDDDVDHAPRHE